MRKLSAQQELFCGELLIDLNATAAAIRAGYAPGSAKVAACRLQQRPQVIERLAQLRQARTKRTQIDADFVLERLVETIERCRRLVPKLDSHGRPIVLKDADGLGQPQFEFDAPGVYRGLELAMKHLGMFVERHELTGKDGGPIEMTEATVTERARRIAFALAGGLRLIQGGKSLPAISVLHQQSAIAGD